MLSSNYEYGLGPDDDYAMNRREAKNAAEEYVIQLAKNREGLDYVWYDARLEAWVAGRNWLHEILTAHLIHQNQ